ncbi:hypothetical protein ACJJTC_007257, partial [Scirpophaga incertulas]
SRSKDSFERVRRKKLRICSSYIYATLIATFTVSVLLLAYNLYASLMEVPQLPKVDLDEYWGPRFLKNTTDTSIRPFRIVFSEAMISDLRARFDRYRNTKVTPSLENTAWTYGVNSETFEQFISYWVFVYDYEKREKYLNQYKHYKTKIQGLDIHFIRVKPNVNNNVKVLPLLLLHGWPGSVREFYEAIPMLTTPRSDFNFVFELIIPSLPGFGYSDATERSGLSTVPIAVIMRNLMHRLGFKQYYVQGGDFGFVVGSHLATLFPDEVLGLHTNLALVLRKSTIITWILGSIWPSLVESDYTDRLYPLSSKISFYLEEFGYYHLQSTKPDTIGTALNDSPAGLAAYILEKFVIGTNSNNKYSYTGGLENINFDDLLDNIMIYWATSSITTSIRLYKERIRYSELEDSVNIIPTRVPVWAMRLKHEIVFVPEFMLKWKYLNLLGTTTLSFGGHFAALELPEIFADDVFLAVNRFISFNEHV